MDTKQNNEKAKEAKAGRADETSAKASDAVRKADAVNEAPSVKKDESKPAEASKKAEEKAEATTEKKVEASKKAEVKTEKKAEAKSENKTEAKPETKAEAKPADKPEAKAKPEKKAENEAAAKEASKPEKKTDAKPKAKAASKQEAKGKIKPEAKDKAVPAAKSAAEAAREERKERVEKAQRSHEKKKAVSPAKKKTAVIVPVLVILLAIIIALCCFFGVPQRTFTALKLEDGTKVSVAEYEYYYMSLYNNYANQAYQYEQQYSSYYGPGAGLMMTGFDYSRTPASQDFKPGEGYNLDKKYGVNPTWADFLEQSTVETCQSFEAFYNEALKENFKPSKESRKQIDSYVEDMRKSAAKNNFSLDAYLRETYGRGMTESLLRKILNKQITVSEFLTKKQESLADGIRKADVMRKYNKNPKLYMQSSLRIFSLQSKPAVNSDKDKHTDAELKKLTKQEADSVKLKMGSFLNEVTEDNFSELALKYAPEEQKEYYKDNDTQTTLKNGSYSDIEKYFGKDAAKWVFARKRRVGDKKFFVTENQDGTVLINTLLITELPSRDDTKQPVSVRHILFMTEKSEQSVDKDGKPKINKTAIRSKAQAKKLAEEALEKWKKQGGDEKAFKKLASELSEDEGSKSNGGLYENITKNSSYVEPFLDWCFKAGRKVGDAGIIESEFGYHVMYMSAIADETEWQANIKQSLADEAFQKYYNKITKEGAHKAKLSEYFAGSVRKRIEKYAETVSKNLIKQAESEALINKGGAGAAKEKH